MLQAIRDRVTGVVAFIILGLLAVPFMFFGIDSYFNTVPQDAVAVVGDQEITVGEFQTEFARYRAQLRQQQGDEYDEIATNQPTVRREFLEEMIDQRLLRLHAQSIGLAVSDEVLLELIRGIEAFQIGGQFSPEAYRQALAVSGLTARGFEQQIREDLLTRTVPTALSGSAVVTEKEIDRLLALRDEMRTASRVDFPSDDYIADVVITDEQVEQFYNDNQALYLTEELVSLRYVELIGDDLVGDFELTEEELRQRYEASKARFMSPELRRASHILLEISDERDDSATRLLAEDIESQLRAGASFSELANTYSADPVSSAEGGDLGWIEPGQMMPAFESALYALDAEGAISTPVKTRFGWHVIRLDGIQIPQGLSFEEARDQIQEEHAAREQEALYIEASERLVDLVFADDTTLEPVAAELDLEIQTTEPFGRQGGLGIASDPQVLEAAFSDRVLLDRAASDPIEIDRNHMVVVILDEFIEPQAVPLELVAPSIEEQLKEEAAKRSAKAAAEAFAAEVADSSEGNELGFGEPQTFGRNDFSQGVDFSRDLFRLPTPSDDAPVISVLPTSQGFAVVSLQEVVPGDPTEAPEQMREIMRQQIAFAQISYEINALMEWLRENTEIAVVEERL